MDILYLMDEPAGDGYSKLVDYALDTSDALMLVYPDINKDSFTQNEIERFNEIQARFKSSLIKSRNNPEWPGTIVNDGCPRDGWNFQVNLYKASDRVRLEMKKPGKLYGWHFPYPTDPSFFRDGKCWFFVTAHERRATVFVESESDRKVFDSLGIRYLERNDWDGEMYFEAYEL